MTLQSPPAIRSLRKAAWRGVSRVREDLVRAYEDTRYGGADVRAATEEAVQAVTGDVTRVTQPLRLAMRRHPILMVSVTAILGAVIGKVLPRPREASARNSL